MEEKAPSEFYFACRNNDIDTVRRILDEQSVEDLDQMEPNGSTGLHAACYYNHVQIVQLLLERGFTRRTINKYKSTPFGEATDVIRDLFQRPKTSNRFGRNNPHEREKLLWILIEDNQQQLPSRYIALDTYDGDRLEYGLFHCQQILQTVGSNMPKADVIRRLFRRATGEKDATRLIQAYTAETDFYNRINDYLFSQAVNTNDVVSEFIDTISLNRQLHEKYHYEGLCYRSVRIKSHYELNIYKVGAKLINRCFLSTTKDRQFAEEYVRTEQDDGAKHSVLIIFEIRQKRTALDIEDLSEFPHEKEVLILLNKIFKVVRVTSKPNLDVEIELRESKSTRVDKKKKTN